VVHCGRWSRSGTELSSFDNTFRVARKAACSLQQPDFIRLFVPIFAWSERWSRVYLLTKATIRRRRSFKRIGEQPHQLSDLHPSPASNSELARTARVATTLFRYRSRPALHPLWACVATCWFSDVTLMLPLPYKRRSSAGQLSIHAFPLISPVLFPHPITTLSKVRLCHL
jgi:hypothetical protein